MTIRQSKGCKRCRRKVHLKDMVLKMGGLLCPTCHVILFYSGLDLEYKYEYHRREVHNEKNSDT